MKRREFVAAAAGAGVVAAGAAKAASGIVNVWWCPINEIAYTATQTLYEMENCETGDLQQHWGAPELDLGQCDTPGLPDCLFAPSQAAIPLTIADGIQVKKLTRPPKFNGRIIDQRVLSVSISANDQLPMLMTQIEVPMTKTINMPPRIYGVACIMADSKTESSVPSRMVKRDGRTAMITLGNVAYCAALVDA